MIACAPPPKPSALPENDSVAAIARDYWDTEMAYSPIQATLKGDRRFEDKLDDLSPPAADAYHAALRVLLARASAMRTDLLNRDLIIDAIENTLRVDDACQYSEWKIDHLEGVHPSLAEMAANSEASGLAARYKEVPRYLDQHMANLRRGILKGRVAHEINVKRSIAQLGEFTVSTFAKTPELEPVVRSHVLPALAKFRAFLRTTVLPEARKGAPGIVTLDIGPACYRAEIRHHTGLVLEPQDIHRLGIDEVARITREMQPIIQRIAKKKISVAELGKLLDADPKQHVATREALLNDTREIVARAQAALPRAFGALPKTTLVVEPLDAYREKESPAAFYNPAPMDGSKPGRYLLNTFEPQARVKYDAEALAFHEGVPGHHLQVALAQELSDLPNFRRFGGQSAYVEGWALYAEKLAKELGLYTSDASDFGRLSSENWRALRLLVDTGLHVYGWSREQAINTMLESAPAPRMEVENEIDRYVTWPGQALAYKIGELEIWRLRRELEKRPGFDLKKFHAVVLGAGPLPLGILGSHVRRSW